MNVLLMLAHSIAEHDDVRMFHEMGYNVFSIGAYTNPAEPDDDKRPPLPQVPYYPDLARACVRVREAHADDPGPRIDWAKADLPDEVIDWADVIIVHHFVEWWLAAQWPRIKHKQVIWRTNGQSNPALELMMGALVREGLQIVRYAESERFMPNFAGRTSLIRFGKEPDEWKGWHGSRKVVGNVTQNMRQRGDACGYHFWLDATRNLPVAPAGPGSEELEGGVGLLNYPALQVYLRSIGVYLYTGTIAAPYTLGLIEAMMTGVPVVSIGGKAWLPDLPDLFEADDLVEIACDDPQDARRHLQDLLADEKAATRYSLWQRAKAETYFGMATIKAHWRAYLG